MLSEGQMGKAWKSFKNLFRK